jgi:hypothetical protein
MPKAGSGNEATCKQETAKAAREKWQAMLDNSVVRIRAHDRFIVSHLIQSAQSL